MQENMGSCKFVQNCNPLRRCETAVIRLGDCAMHGGVVTTGVHEGNGKTERFRHRSSYAISTR